MVVQSAILQYVIINNIHYGKEKIHFTPELRTASVNTDQVRGTSVRLHFNSPNRNL